MNRYALTVFVEEGSREGGFGEYAAELSRRRNCTGWVLVLAAEERFAALGTRDELLRMNGLDGAGIAAAVSACVPEETGSPAARSWMVAEPK